MASTEGHANFMKIFNDAEFSDVLVTVTKSREGTKSYYLRQAIIRTLSKTLDSRCKATPSKSRYIRLSFDTTDHAIMEIFFRWMYGERDLREKNLSLSDLAALMKVAQEFQVDDLCDTIIQNAVALAISKIHKNPSTPQYRANNWNSYWNAVEVMCGSLGGGDTHDLVVLEGLIAKLPINSIFLDDITNERLAHESDLGNLAFLMIGVLRKALEKTLCDDCQEKSAESVIKSHHSYCSNCLKVSYFSEAILRAEG
ncbi:hypothetical protein AOL_s00110g204 [Orbilia oligospora ATCC 24927]|uniref:BTB domain-containing protein n=1 Tax=Arthrobotrys oligospora (strain ATCC 24927 / CBS 115.81 / DSM 1491) TaxID=756982 RepID=G1XL34_ARTOA|nr:hypothetical protein AOL_s00110g204 [Orbilia oligospora ATCC 24927]EGX46040.1 hypothetical protein AOL_s00110g204 [Orbilia oligospora ATCC 24927]